jgi:uncharacterized protein (TIGR00730 family)
VIRSVTVYLSARDSIDEVYFKAAAALGTAIAKKNWTLVYGGNNVGLMRAVADAARAAKGKVVGVTPQLMEDQGISDAKCDELIVTRDMRERKGIMEAHGDAFIILPGGLGTFEELFEILVGRQLGYHQKPIVFLNTAEYYKPLLTMLKHGIDQRFIKSNTAELYHVSETVDDVIAYLESFYPLPIPPDVKVAAE